MYNPSWEDDLYLSNGTNLSNADSQIEPIRPMVSFSTSDRSISYNGNIVQGHDLSGVHFT